VSSLFVSDDELLLVSSELAEEESSSSTGTSTVIVKLNSEDPPSSSSTIAVAVKEVVLVRTRLDISNVSMSSVMDFSSITKHLPHGRVDE